MAELPSGTVTLLFTDVEGSTRLLRQLGDRYHEVLGEHRRLLREAFAQNGGQEIGTEGDSFFVVFRRVKDAVAAAAQAQRALADHPWPDGAELLVRMGIHTAEPLVAEDNYVGLGVHRAARIMAAGHGGQVLLSSATRALLLEDPPAGISLRDLGEQRLKDFDEPEHVYQLVGPDLLSEFPPLKTLAHQPEDATPFDEGELAEAAAALAFGGRLRSHARLLAGVAALVLGGGIAAVVVLVTGPSAQGLPRVDANAMGMVNSQGTAITSEVAVGASPARIAVGSGTAWVTNFDDQTVSRVDLANQRVDQTIKVGSGPSGIAVGKGAVWVANNLDGTISRIDPRTNAVVQTIDVGNGPNGVAYGLGAVWVANTGDHTISRIDPRKGNVKRTTSIGASPTELAVGANSLWVTSEADRTVSRVDPKTGNVIQSIGVGVGPLGIAFGANSAWVANSLDGTVTRVDARTNSVAATIPVGNGPTGVAASTDAVWVTNEFGGSLVRIDPSENEVVRTTWLGNRPEGIALAEGSVLVTVRASGARHRGGRLTELVAGNPVKSIDPAFSYNPRELSTMIMTNDGLTGFKRVGGSNGTQLVPDLAVSLPTPTDRGTTYTFQLRPNIRYSNGMPVRASDFRRAIERGIALRSSGLPLATGIAGVRACVTRPGPCHLSSGIVADDGAGTVTFHLVPPDPDFPEKLALPLAFAVPPGTPSHKVGTKPIPATGPYMIASYRPGDQVRLVRNPQFHEWSQAAQPDGYPDEIVIKTRGSVAASIRAIERGQADLLAQDLSASQYSALVAQHASQVHVNPLPATFALFMNTRVPPFDDVRVRRALNYAVDRAAAAQAFGGPQLAQPTCQILPPNFPGFERYCPYTLDPRGSGIWSAPDLGKARRLVAASGTRGMKVTVWSFRAPGFDGLTRVGASGLRKLGYRVSVRVVSANAYSSAVLNSSARIAIGPFGLPADYPAASTFFVNNFSCRSFRPGTGANPNVAEFCSPALDARMQAVLTAESENPQAANALWAKVDREVVDLAPWAPLVNKKAHSFVSSRVGNFQYNPQWGALVDQLWVR